MDCTEVLEQLSDYLDAEARAELCRQIDAHLARCSRCQVHVDTVRKTILLYHNEANARCAISECLPLTQCAADVCEFG